MDSSARTDSDAGLGSEVRQSLVLLTVSIGVTTLVTVAAQAAASLLG
jgi:hypothetical protein